MITSHVVSLELSKKLKEIGVPQVSEFYWAKVAVNSYELDRGLGRWGFDPYSDENVAAHLATELLEILPKKIHGFYGLVIDSKNDSYDVWYGGEDYDAIVGVSGKSLPDALAFMVLELYKRGILTFGQESVKSCHIKKVL